MFHQQIHLPEQHQNYPSLWQSLNGKYRIIRCPDDLQYIVQRHRNAKKGWEVKSFHVDWNSISLIHGNKEAFRTLIQPI